MSDNEFINGLYFNEPRPNAPDFVKGSLGIQRDRFIEWLQSQPEENVKIDLLVSKGGKWYAQKNNYKAKDSPEGQRQDKPRQSRQAPVQHADASNGTGPEPSFVDDEIPFAPIPRRQLW